MIDTICILGAGTMGANIALNFGLYGLRVNLYEANEEALASAPDRIRASLEFLAEEDYIPAGKVGAALSNITTYSRMSDAASDADYVIEAVFEDLALKKRLFGELDIICRQETVLASNTSSLSLGDIIEDLPAARQAKCMVCHWYNPPHIMPLVELSCFGNMSQEDFGSIYELYESIEKIPVRVNKDIPGLIANRIQQGVAREVFSLIEMGAASERDIEKALTFGPAFRYATAGQLEIADMGGLDIWCTVGDNLLKVMDNSQHANNLLRQKVKDGKLGIKSGEGFFTYTEEDKKNAVKSFQSRLITQLKVCRNYLK